MSSVTLSHCNSIIIVNIFATGVTESKEISLLLGSVASWPKVGRL